MQSYFARLRDGGTKLGASTEAKYLAVIRRMEAAKEPPTPWLTRQAEELDGTGERAHRTTIGVLRSAVTHYLRWKHLEATGELVPEDEVLARFGKGLVKTSKGVRGEQRDALSREQYQLYLDTVDGLTDVPEQIRAVLKLLPRTGLRISEACSLKRKNVEIVRDTWTLRIIGKGGKERTVPLGKARQIIEPFMQGKTPDDYLFVNPYWGATNSARPDLSPGQVRAVVRDRLQTVAGLADVVPHVLRHQFATATVKAKSNVFAVMAVLGHSDLETMKRYTHPDEDDKQDVVDAVDAVLDKLDKRA
jgi:integrase